MSRQGALILALAALAVAAMAVSVWSWVLLWMERRDRRRASRTTEAEEAAGPAEPTL